MTLDTFLPDRWSSPGSVTLHFRIFPQLQKVFHVTEQEANTFGLKKAKALFDDEL